MADNFNPVDPCEELRKFVSCYYFIRSEDPNFTSKHYSFPHTYNALSIYKDCEFDSSPSNFTARQGNKSNYQLFIQVKKQAPLMVDIRGKVNRATILFKDFGINQFMNEPLSAVMGYRLNQLTSWKEDLKFPDFMNDLFATDHEGEKGKIIDEFLLHRLKPNKFTDLEIAVSLLCDFEADHSVEEIATRINVSLRSFNRNFKEVLGVSPIEYRRIAQFRHSIANKLHQPQFKRLTDIGYESHFYDQSYFNKIYQKLAGSNPKQFFKSIERIGDDKLIFKFIKG